MSPSEFISYQAGFRLVATSAYFGVEPDFQEHGGMKFAKVHEGSPAGNAGFQTGDVLIEYGGRKIDSYIDYARLVHAYNEGKRVAVTAMRGKEKITREVTLVAMP
jgi:S1-C subfamily serine protease